jgi:hypothetical protein
MHQTPRIWSLAVVGLAALFVAGCAGEGTKRPPLGKVTGTVTYKGKPVSGAAVSFIMDRAPRAATGMTDVDGNYKLTTFDTFDGAFVGTHKVTVVKFDPNAAGVESKENSPEDLVKLMATGKYEPNATNAKTDALPAKYANASTTPLQFTIEPGANEKKIELED